MELSFDCGPYESYGFLEESYESLMGVAFKMLGVKKNYEVDVSLVDEKTIQDINREYRGKDAVTDVISFAFEDDQSELGQIQGDDVPRMLGEIFLCIPRALAQAKEIGNSENRELLFLFCHGLLHLLGYDHMTKEDEEKMFPLQEKILDAYLKEAPHAA